MLQRRFGREVIVCRDMPAFAGNRVGFKVLNEVAQLAEKRGVAFAEYLIGPYTGRAMAPLATIDLVGWDVHKAIVDNVHANTRDEAHQSFALPTYMAELIDEGHLGNKSADKGGFYRRIKEAGKPATLVLDPASGGYKPASDVKVEPLPFVEKMRELHRIGCYADAFQIFVADSSEEAKLARKVVFGYVSYGLNRVGEGEVVAHPRDVDRIMGFGFNWAPPSVLVDVVGAPAAIKAIESAGLVVPAVLQSLKPGERLFRERGVNIGRFFAA
jgi:3-hydroxyacyl-CoA dehydrogenase